MHQKPKNNIVQRIQKMITLFMKKLTWVILGMTLCHLDLVSYMGSLLGWKIKIKMWLLNPSIAWSYFCERVVSNCNGEWTHDRRDKKAFKLSMSSRNGIFNFMVSIFVGKCLWNHDDESSIEQKLGKNLVHLA